MPEPPSPNDFADVVAEAVAGLDVELAFEPGRVIAANAGVLVSEVIHIHERPEGRRFLVIDAAMNDLLRPAMYDAYHDIRPIRARDGEPQPYDVVGPVCETADCFQRDARMAAPLEGDLYAILDAGAYGFAMSSNYNFRPRAAEVLVDDGSARLVRRRETFADLIRLETS